MELVNRKINSYGDVHMWHDIFYLNCANDTDVPKRIKQIHDLSYSMISEHLRKLDPGIHIEPTDIKFYLGQGAQCFTVEPKKWKQLRVDELLRDHGESLAALNYYVYPKPTTGDQIFDILDMCVTMSDMGLTASRFKADAHSYFKPKQTNEADLMQNNRIKQDVESRYNFGLNQMLKKAVTDSLERLNALDQHSKISAAIVSRSIINNLLDVDRQSFKDAMQIAEEIRAEQNTDMSESRKTTFVIASTDKDCTLDLRVLVRSIKGWFHQNSGGKITDNVGAWGYSTATDSYAIIRFTR